MKKITLTLLLAFIFAGSSLFALDNYPFSVGANIFAKVGINPNTPPPGIQNAVSFLKGVDAGVNVYFPMSNENRSGVFVELGYTNMPFGLKQYGTDIVGYLTQRYLSISPIALISGFGVGLDFGFKVFDDVVDNFQMLPIEEDININIRVEFLLPIFTTTFGTLNLDMKATYSITGSGVANTTYNPVTAGVGLNYLINLESKNSNDDYID